MFKLLKLKAIMSEVECWSRKKTWLSESDRPEFRYGSPRNDLYGLK